MLLVSQELYDRLCHSENKRSRPLKLEELVARDTFTGETMVLQSPEEFFGEPSKSKKRKPRTKKPQANA